MKFIIELTLNKDEIEEVRNRFKILPQIEGENFTTEDAIKDFFRFNYSYCYSRFHNFDLRSNVKIKKKRKMRKQKIYNYSGSFGNCF